MHARTEATQEQAAAWPEEIFSILQRYDVRQVGECSRSPLIAPEDKGR